MNFFYKIILLTSLHISCPDINATNLWTRLNSPTSVDLRNCTFADQLNGWAAGDDGVIIRTSDGGETFVVQNSTINYYINDIYFINKRLGWSVANEFFFVGSTILQTTNGGDIWTSKIFPDTSIIFRTIYFLDSLTGFLAGFGGVIYKTTDAGNSWFAALVDSSEFSGFPISRIKFVNNNLGFACGGYTDVAGVIWKTTNGGLLWNAGAESPEPFYDLFIKDVQEIITVGGDFEYGVQITKTSNAGLNWNYSSLKMFGQAHSIDFRTENEAWMALGYAESWAFSSNAGITWISIPTVDSSGINSVDFADSLHGYAVGNGGVILKYNSLTSTPNPVSLKIPVSIILSQNYPNPFNPVTVISYQLSVSSYTQLKVNDILGNLILTLVDKKQNAGSYSIEFDGTNLPSGIYFYELKAGDYSDVKRMLLLK
ncbi:MAG: YCF48-related protein [Bacteroidota bacterium]|nr:YCF48-related protein [Bacteroidota bacterium]